MANSGKITEFIDTASTSAQYKTFADQVDSLDEKFIELTKTVLAFNNAAKDAKGFADFNKNAAAAAVSTEKLAQVQNQTAITATKLAQEEAKLATINNKVAISQNQLATSTLRAQTAQEKATAAITKALSPYQQLSKELDRQRLAAKDLAVQYGLNSEEFKKAQVEVLGLDSRLKTIDKSLGQNQRNVGNYGSALSSIYGVIRKAAYILPGIGIAGIFNLLFEGIDKAATAAGIFNEKITVAVSNLRNFNDVTKEASKQAGEQSTNLRILYQAATDVSNSMRERIKAAQELKKEFPDEFKNASDLSIINGELSGTYRQLTQDILANAKARAAASKIAELAAQQLEIDFQKQKIINAKSQEIAAVKPSTRPQNAATDAVGGFLTPAQQRASIAAQQQTLKDLLRGELEQADARKKALQDQIDFLTSFAEGNNKIASALSGSETGTSAKPKIDLKGVYNEQVKAAKLAEEAILNNQDASYEERLAAITTYYNTVYDLTKAASDKQILTQQEASNQFQAIDNETSKQRISVITKANEAILNSFKEGIKDLEALQAIDIINFKDAQDTKLLEIEQNKSDTIKALTDQYEQGKIKSREYNQEVYDIESSASDARIQLQIDTIQKIIDEEKKNLSFGIGSARELQKNQDELTRLRIQQSDLATRVEIENAKRLDEEKQRLHQREKELFEESLNLIKTIVDAGYNNQLNALQDISDQVDKNAEQEKQTVQNSLASDRNKARQEAIIDAQTQARKEQIAQQEREIKRKQAEFDKAVSIARIIEQTAVAIVEALPNVVLATIVGAIGAVQLATAIATPLPTYGEGTDNHPGGLAIIGDKGRELVTLPNGYTFLSDSKSTIVDLPKGSTVIPNLQTNALLGDKNYVGGQQISFKELSDLMKENNHYQKKLLNKPVLRGYNGLADEMIRAQKFSERKNSYLK